MKRLFVLLIPATALLLVTGCKTTQSTRAKPLKTVFGQNADLSKYQVVTVQPFEVNSSQAANAQVGSALATDIANRLQYDFGPLFQTVRVGTPWGAPNELVVNGRITDYRPGSRAARFFGPGIGRAELKGEMVLKDGPTGQPLVIAPIDKLWAWGDILGVSKGMNNMMEETAASAANLIARTKGWEPIRAVGAAPGP